MKYRNIHLNAYSPYENLMMYVFKAIDTEKTQSVVYVLH